MLHQGGATAATKSIHIALIIREVRGAQYIQDTEEKHEEKLNKIPLAAACHRTCRSIAIFTSIAANSVHHIFTYLHLNAVITIQIQCVMVAMKPVSVSHLLCGHNHRAL